MPTTRLNSRLLRVFLLHVVVISITVVCGITAAAFVVEKVLVNRALVSEADYFWQQRQLDANFHLPNTLNLRAFIEGSGAPAPDGFAELKPGQQRVSYAGGEDIVYVSVKNGQRLYLIFKEEQVQTLAFLFGVLPLILVLLVLYGLSYYSFLQSKKAVSPIVALANRIESFDITRNDSSQLSLADIATGSDTEVDLLVQAFEHLTQRTRALIERERNFTRYASHELRTPLAVIKGSVSSLELAALDRLPQRALERIKRTSNDMESLLDTLLLLAREENIANGSDTVIVNDLVALLTEQIDTVAGKPEVIIKQENRALLQVNAAERVLSILLSNIIRNARAYTEAGEISITIESDRISIKDTGCGIEAAHLKRIFEPFFREDDTREGYGLGLAIVKRICDESGWQIEVKSEAGVGTEFTVVFSAASGDVLEFRRSA